MQNSYRIHVTSIELDELTPVSAYLRLRDVFPGSILLESSAYAQQQSGHSYVCCHPEAGVEVYGEQIHSYQGRRRRSERQPRQAIAEMVDDFLSSFTFEETNPACCNGKFFGHFNYDAVQYFDGLRLQPDAEAVLVPDISLHLYRFMLVFDHAANRIYLTECYPDKQDGELRTQLLTGLRSPDQPAFGFDIVGAEHAYTTESDFLRQVEQARQYCREGEVFQLVLSRRFRQAFYGDDFDVYRALRRINPSPYLFYFDRGNYRLMGSSPETQLKISNGEAVLHPIAGTRFRSEVVSDAELKQELLSDSKENAEHVMLVDLARNDLSKGYDQVDVTRFKAIQQFSHVLHMVSEVSGKRPLHSRPVQQLGATFPAGTLSGAPKYRAMQLIDRHEPVGRNYYGGCIGYITPSGDMDMAIMIRSALSLDSRLYYQAGAGIVEQSDPETELREVAYKLKAIRLSVEQAARKPEHPDGRPHKTTSAG